MRIIVTGGRNYDDEAAVDRVLGEYASVRDVTIVHGGARGLDELAAFSAALIGYEIERHPADWAAHGRPAGPIRNQKMVDLGADLCIAFPGGRGTADMVRRALAAGIPVREVQ